MRLLTRCVPSLTSSHAPHPSASTATKYCTFPCASTHPPRAWHPPCASPLALSLCTTFCTHHLSLFVSFLDRSECELYNEVRYSVWHAGFPAHPSYSMVTPMERPDHRRNRHDRAIPSAEPPCPEAASSSTAQTSMSARARRASASPSRPIPSEHATAKHCTCTGLHTGTLRG